MKLLFAPVLSRVSYETFTASEALTIKRYLDATMDKRSKEYRIQISGLAQFTTLIKARAL